MPNNFAITQAIAAAKKTPPPVPSSYMGPRGEPFSWKKTAEKVVGPDEQASEGLVMSRLNDLGIHGDARCIVNGTTPELAAMIDLGLLRYADRSAGMLERSRPTPRPVVRSVFRPPTSSESKELRQLRGQVRELSAMVSGEAPAMPAVYVGAGRALIRNPYRYELPLADQVTKIGPGEVMEVDEDYAARAVSTGVLHAITPEECSRLIAANAPL